MTPLPSFFFGQTLIFLKHLKKSCKVRCLYSLSEDTCLYPFFYRFCAECIVTALRSGNKECPTCRKKLVSRRSLRADPNFDKLVEKIFPNRDEYEAHQESILETLSRSHSQNFITSFTRKSCVAKSLI